MTGTSTQEFLAHGVKAASTCGCFSARVSMRNQRSYSHFTINDLAEVMQAKRESAEPIGRFQRMAVSVAHRGFGYEVFWAKECLISRVGVEYEGRDNTDTQDAAWTMVESKPYPDPQLESMPGIKLIG
jgi:hypothetical protein